MVIFVCISKQQDFGAHIAWRELSKLIIFDQKNLNIAEEGDLNLSLNQEALHMMICSETEDHKNAAKAFVNFLAI